MKISTTRRALLFAAGTALALGCRGREEVESSPPATGSSAGEPFAAITLPEGAEAISLLGEPLYPPVPPLEIQREREIQLAEALAQLETDPGNAEAMIWAGRRYAYLGQYRRAIELFSQGIEAHPADPRFYRHRGHRFISVREFDGAIADFRRAEELIRGKPDEVEPDGQPNALGIPTSTLHFNIFYHFGLAHFLKGEFEEAAQVYRRCLAASVHADSKVATAHWLYMTLRRQGQLEEARALMASLDLEALASEIIESGSYLELLRLYARQTEAPEGPPSPEDPDPETLEGATLGYGIGNFFFYNGEIERARGVFQRIVAARDQWAAFGYIAAEADLARMGARPGP